MPNLIEKWNPFKLDGNFESLNHDIYQKMAKTANRNEWVHLENLLNSGNRNNAFTSKWIEWFIKESPFSNLNRCSNITDPHLKNYRYIAESIDFQKELTYLMNLYIMNTVGKTQQWDIYTTGGNKKWTEFIENFAEISVASYRPPNYPSSSYHIETPSFERMDFIVNECIMVFDIMTRGDGDEPTSSFVLDTQHLDKYEIKREYPKLGVLAHFRLTSQKGLRMYKFTYQGKTFRRTNEEEDEECQFALHAMWMGILQYATICSHLLQSHLMIALRTANINRAVFGQLDDDDGDDDRREQKNKNPLFQLLYMFDANVWNVTAEALFTLLNPVSAVTNCFSFTNDGIIQMMNDYYGKYQYQYVTYCGKEVFPNLHLTKKEKARYPFRTYDRYRALFRRFSTDFVDGLFHDSRWLEENEEVVFDWIDRMYHHHPCAPTATATTTTTTIRNRGTYRKALIDILGALYFEQIQHRMLDNPNILYLLLRFPNVYFRESSSSRKNEVVVDAAFYQIIYVFYKTNCTLVPLTKKMSFFTDYRHRRHDWKKLKKCFDVLHSQIMQLEREFCAKSGKGNRHVLLLQPSKISLSTGY